ncbi:DUF2993 domain-containing protein [Streptomyces sp. PT12]|uniref:LmeA family phospholipid-binding protein n=1 Tax=Streptomyces sp. PT12 TaxID=1510197 RepID=UPI000DE2A5A4|nr:DUF2993 domain-containing protein [Streptomyces sp. PT12]RBM17846.1 hypothetical protein DEH69_14325 [Streptomyces sp. PT12]
MRALRISLIVVGVLLLLGIAADRVAVWVAQNEVASRARTTLDLSSEPDVTIQGFPFLTQVFNTRLDHVDLGLDSYEASVDDQTLTVEDLEVELRNVEVSGDFSGATAETAEGGGVVSYEELSRAYGELLAVAGNGFAVEFGYAGEGRLLLTLQASVMGQHVDVGEAPGDIVLEDGVVTLSVDEADIPDTGRPELQEAVQEQLDQERTISGLPDGLELDSLTPTEEGLALTISGSQVSVG